MGEDYYQTLGVSRDATSDDIRRAYKRLAMKHHPDRNPGDKEAEKKFKDLQEAYRVLDDPEKRAMYDNFGKEAANGAAGDGFGFGGDFNFGGFSNFRDFHDFLFGGSGATEAGGGFAHDIVIVDLPLSFEEAALGCKKKFNAPVSHACDSCGGSGAAKGSKPETCPQCRGHGVVGRQHGFVVRRQTCPRCDGHKRVFDSCKACRGRRRVRRDTTVRAQIPTGVRDGSVLQMDDIGVRLRVRVAAHPLFSRAAHGNDLRADIPISIITAAFGGEIKIPTLGGGHAIVTLPPETQSGRVLRLRGQGIDGGDLLCRVQVETPVNLNPQQRELLRRFGESIQQDGGHAPQEEGWLEKVRRLWADGEKNGKK